MDIGERGHGSTIRWPRSPISILYVVAMDIGERGHLIVEPCPSVPSQWEGVLSAEAIKPSQLLRIRVDRHDKAPAIRLQPCGRAERVFDLATAIRASGGHTACERLQLE